MNRFKFNGLFGLLSACLGFMTMHVDEPGGGAATPPANKPNGDTKTFSQEYVNELREENKAWRLKYEGIKGENVELKATAAKAKTDADEAIKAASTTADGRILQSELKAHAIKAGLVDLDALKLADLSKVKLNDKGEIEGADTLFTDLKTAKPYLFGTPGTPANTGASTSQTGTPPQQSNGGGDVRGLQGKDYAAARSKFLATNS